MSDCCGALTILSAAQKAQVAVKSSVHGQMRHRLVARVALADPVRSVARLCQLAPDQRPSQVEVVACNSDALCVGETTPRQIEKASPFYHRRLTAPHRDGSEAVQR